MLPAKVCFSNSLLCLCLLLVACCCLWLHISLVNLHVWGSSWSTSPTCTYCTSPPASGEALRFGTAARVASLVVLFL